ncbi:hypothetical protein BKA70DRAFT_751424 [Coprinopsis sp. MPI-PUGE-AT-0042]|nr:hypothetical protein BKA70DRAFT_751424 [Coprinopsis sp. MPI-PUGE-AT-0042]
MRFNIIVAVSLLCTLVSGFSVSSRLSERETDLVNARREFLDFAEELHELAARAKIKGQYNVAAGGGKQAQTYSRKDVKNAVKAANAEKTRLSAPGTSKTQIKKSPLKPFGNSNHQVPKAGASGPNSLPKVKGGNLHEFPLKNKHQGTAADKGPARVILREDNRGKLRFKGVVAHDQSRPVPPPGVKGTGANDHFEVKGKAGRRRK